MGHRKLRDVERFDYKPYNDRGERIPLPPDTEMSSDAKAIAKAVGELSGLIFQVGEILDDLQDVNALGIETLRGQLEELKVLRVSIVKVNSELKLLRSEMLDDGDPKTDKDVSDLLAAKTWYSDES